MSDLSLCHITHLLTINCYKVINSQKNTPRIRSRFAGAGCTAQGWAGHFRLCYSRRRSEALTG